MKILVPTDMSENSRGALLFAREIAWKFNCQLIVIHVTEIADEQQWANAQEKQLREQHEQEIINRLEYFVSETFSTTGPLFFDYSCILHYHYGFVHTILDYALKYDCSHICITSSGGRVVDKWLGTKATALLEESSVPVFCVPEWYKPAAIDVVIYATDMAYLDDELAKITTFSGKFEAKVYAVHLSEKSDENKISYPPNENVVFLTLPRDKKLTFSEQLREISSFYGASLLIMVADKRKGFLESLFAQSKSKELSFNTQIPLLVYHRNTE